MILGEALSSALSSSSEDVGAEREAQYWEDPQHEELRHQDPGVSTIQTTSHDSGSGAGLGTLLHRSKSSPVTSPKPERKAKTE